MSAQTHINGPATRSPVRPRITVLGAGVVGMTCALELSKTNKVTIVARNMPGDPPSLGWSSPWAGAMWLPSAGDKGEEKDFPVVSYVKFRELAEQEPECSVVRVGCYDYRDSLPSDLRNTWYGICDDLRVLGPDELKLGAGAGLYYKTITLNPELYIEWLRGKCEKAGIDFVRYDCSSLEEASKIAPCDAIVNATGVGSRYLRDVMDDKVQSVRGQTMIVKCNATEIEACHSDKYTYVIPHGDGTATLGGIKEYHDFEPSLKDYVQRAIHKRCHEICPEHVPAKFEDLEILRHNVGFRPERGGAVRCEGEVIKGKKVVHAYGMNGGFVYSWGMAEEVVRLISDLVDSDADDLAQMVRAKL